MKYIDMCWHAFSCRGHEGMEKGDRERTEYVHTATWSKRQGEIIQQSPRCRDDLLREKGEGEAKSKVEGDV